MLGGRAHIRGEVGLGNVYMPVDVPLFSRPGARAVDRRGKHCIVILCTGKGLVNAESRRSGQCPGTRVSSDDRASVPPAHRGL
jgi:hypothetical protein